MRLPLFLLLPVVATAALSEHGVLLQRDGNAHSHHGTVLSELNETQILEWHDPTPPSYWSVDFNGDGEGDARYPGLMAVHVLFMCLAFFGALPVGRWPHISYELCSRSNRKHRHCTALCQTFMPCTQRDRFLRFCGNQFIGECVVQKADSRHVSI